ncbi:hypothetical protein AAE478_004372 [Parahypoxylon ruwenzoriense]
MQSYHHDTASTPNKGKEPATSSWSVSSQPPTESRMPSEQRPRLSSPSFVRPQATLTTSRSLGALEALNRKSNTWTSSSADLELEFEGDERDDRKEFVNEYNRLAKKVTILFNTSASQSLPIRKGSWLSKALRRASLGQSTLPVATKPDQQQLRRRRSISDVALNLVHHPRKDALKDEDLTSLVRLCGKSLFYLPAEYAPFSLVLPTCFRALAQALVQQADTRGIFRVPGSIRIVNTLYDYYCADRDTDDISSTTRCPNLPAHIKCSVHDVASAFKRFLAGLPGGILGSLSLFDALVAIHSQLHADPELTKTRETKLRARLIALAIGTVKSQYQRELICAVFGLLCFIGRAAENAPREDEDGRPLPTADLMGYNALGIIFGPLLVNELIDSYSMKVADPASGLVLLPLSPPKSRKEKRKRSRAHTDDSASLFPVDKIHVANSITEMLIIHWREVVRQMRSLGTLKIRRAVGSTGHRMNRSQLISSASDSFALRKPPRWDGAGLLNRRKNRDISPMARSPTPTPKTSLSKPQSGTEDEFEPLSIKRQRSRPSSSGTSRRVSTRASAKCLSPTVEESPSAEFAETNSGRALHLTTSSAGRTPLRPSLETAFRKPNLGRQMTSSGSETESKKFEFNEQLQNPVEPYDVDVRRSAFNLHNGSLSERLVSGSEVTFHSIRSPILEIRNDEGHLSRTSMNYLRAKEPKSHGQHSSRSSASAGSPLSPKEPSNIRAEYKSNTQGGNASPVGKWEALSRASRASTESLAKVTKERRLRRSPGYNSFRQSEESLIQDDQKPGIPEWKRQLMNKRDEGSQKARRLSPEKRSIFGKSPQSGRSRETSSPQKPESLSPAKSAFEGGSRPVSQRSSSRPVNGAVKAMAALFDNAIKESPASSGAVLIGKTGLGSKVPSIILSPRYSKIDSPTKSIKTEGSPALSTPLRRFRSTEPASPASCRNVGPVSSRAAVEGTPPKFPHISVRPSGASFSAPRKVPQASPAKENLRDRELDQPPSLGTMISHLEEPPVAQHITFIRPHPSTPPMGGDGSGDERFSTESPRPGSSNSILHTQIRRLQKQLELRTEERAQLRRRLEARENMDIGRLCEQLRTARRECKIWRQRAEAAERRVAVFKRFTARVRGLRDAVIQETGESLVGDEQVDGSSLRRTVRGRRLRGSDSSSFHSSEHTETQEVLRSRIRRSIKNRAAYTRDGDRATRRGEDGELFGNSGSVLEEGTRWKENITGDGTTELWDIAEELLAFDASAE